ncbi:hypothetical protein D3C79_836180 [compost metagenome]
MAAHLHHLFELAIGRRRQYRQGAARVFGHRVIADKQMAAIDAEAGMGRLIAQAWHLVQGLEAAVLANGKTADLAVAGAILVDRE